MMNMFLISYHLMLTCFQSSCCMFTYAHDILATFLYHVRRQSTKEGILGEHSVVCPHQLDNRALAPTFRFTCVTCTQCPGNNFPPLKYTKANTFLRGVHVQLFSSLAIYLHTLRRNYPPSLAAQVGHDKDGCVRERKPHYKEVVMWGSCAGRQTDPYRHTWSGGRTLNHPLCTI